MSQKGFEESQERELFMFQGEVSLKKDVPKVKSVRVELTPADATKPVKVEELNVFACGEGNKGCKIKAIYESASVSSKQQCCSDNTCWRSCSIYSGCSWRSYHNTRCSRSSCRNVTRRTRCFRFYNIRYQWSSRSEHTWRLLTNFLWSDEFDSESVFERK